MEENEAYRPPSIAACWNSLTPSMSSMIVIGLLVICGIGVALLGAVGPIAENVDRAEITIVTSIIGAVLLGMAFLIWFLGQVGGQRALEVFSDRIELVTKKSVHVVRFDEIEKVETWDFAETQFEKIRQDIVITPMKGSAIFFNTGWEGSPLAVLEKLFTSCDHIIRNPEGYTRK